jgi:hypothetical protein
VLQTATKYISERERERERGGDSRRVLQTATKDGRKGDEGILKRFRVSQIATKYTREGGR